MKLNTTYILLVAFIIILLIGSLYQKQKNKIEDQKACFQEFNKEVHGIVEKAFFDENPENKGYVVVFQDGTSYRPTFLTKWQHVNLNYGDSLYKNTGTFKVVIVEKGISKPTIIEDTIDCNNLQ